MPVALHWKLTLEFGVATKDSGQAITFGAAEKCKQELCCKSPVIKFLV